MNAEFIQTMLQAKRLEAQAFALLVPVGARQVVAGAVRACSAAALDVLEEPPAATGEAGTGKAPAASRPAKRSGMRPIVIE